MKRRFARWLPADPLPHSPALTVPMEESHREAAVDSWREGFARSIEAKRARARELLAGGQRRLKELEGQLGHRLDDLAKQVTNHESQSRHIQATGEERIRSLDDRSRELGSREQRLAHLLDDVQRRLGELHTRQHEVE